VADKLPIQDYVRYAFHNYYNYGVLTLFGGLTVLDWNWGWAFVGAALEAIYLYALVSNPRFQRHVESVAEDEQHVRVDKLRDALWQYIDPKLQKRYQDVEQLSARLRKDMPNFSQLRDPLLKENIRKISTLLASYLKLCVAITRYRGYLSSVDPQQLNKDIDRLEQEALDAEPRVVEIKQKNIDILQKRLEKNTKAKANVEYLSAQLDTIEDTMRLVVDQAVTLSDPKGMSTQIDSLLTTLNDTELIAQEIDSFEELDSGYSDEIPEVDRRERN
jgi:hypothetical protein